MDCTGNFRRKCILHFYDVPVFPQYSLDEAAKIDGCNSFQTLIRVLLPNVVPAMISVAIFQFLTTWNDFFNQMIYISSTKKYTVTLALRMSLDTAAGVSWNNIIAMAVVSVVPLVILFFGLQKYFVEGVSMSSGIKG